MYIIKKTGVSINMRCYVVATPGSKYSYTRSKERAKRYETREQALAACCGNEVPIEL